MSTEYTGTPANVTTPLARTIIDVTLATPMQVQTSASHGYSTNDYVEISGVLGATEANAGWQITVTGLDTFTLNGSVGVNAYLSAGSVTDESLTPTMTQPADGDLRSAASVNLAIDTLADRSQFLVRRSRKQRHTWTAAGGTFVVPSGVYYVDVELMGGGGGGGAGAGSGHAGTGNGPGGGGARKIVRRLRVVPGETITFAQGAGGAGGTGGAIGAIGTHGGHGLDSTLTGSISGLLLTAYGAMGGSPAAYATAGFSFGGLAYPLDLTYRASGILGYPFRGVVPQTVAGGIYPTRPESGQGGMGGGSHPSDYTHGGGTAENPCGSGVTVASDGTGAGGSSEWPTGQGGAAVTSNAFNKGVAGNPGEGPGAGGSGGGGGFSAHAGGAGGAGIPGACAIWYNGHVAVTT